MRDRHYCLPAARTFAKELSERFLHTLEQAAAGAREPGEGSAATDALAVYEHRAIEALRDNVDLMRKVRSNGVAWGALKAFLLGHLPETLDNRDRDDLAYRLVPKALDEILGGRQGSAWHTVRNEGRTYVKAGREGYSGHEP